MKFQRIVVGLIAVILAVNVVGIGLIVAEEKKKTEIAYTMALNQDAINESLEAIINTTYDIVHGYDGYDVVINREWQEATSAAARAMIRLKAKYG